MPAQAELVAELAAVLGDADGRTAAARGLYGGTLPSWFVPDDQRAKVDDDAIAARRLRQTRP